MLTGYARQYYTSDLTSFSNGIAYLFLIVVCIPFYLCFIRPFTSRYVPGMLKRMGLGMLLVLLSLIATFAMDMVFHSQDKISYCAFTSNESILDHELNTTTFFEDPPCYLVLHYILLALSYILIYIGVFEFICSQSPQSMKGMLIGLLFAIKGLFQLLAIILIAIVISPSWSLKSSPICGFGYYLMGLVVGVPSFLVYVWVARKYKYRVRDEPSKERQYAEEYYSKPQKEESYTITIKESSVLHTTDL